MPNRIIKESIRTSRSINAMTDFQFRLWTYLITYVDDYGRGSADPELLKGFVFPRRKGVTEATISKTLAELATIGSILLYTVDGESYLCFPNWSDHQTIRNKRSKFPSPADGTITTESNCNQLNADVPVIQSNPNPNPNPNINSGAGAPSSAMPKGVYTEIIDFLNEQAGTRYKASSQKTRTLIRARLKEGFTVDDFKTVIQKKCQLWKGTEFEQYLRPETLFGTKFESYLNERQNAAVRQSGSRSKPRNALQVAHPPTPEEEAEQARRIEENQRWMREFLQNPGSDKQ